MNSWPKVRLCQVEVGTKISQNDSSSLHEYEVISGHYWPQFTWKLPLNMKLGRYYSLQFGLIYPYLAPQYHVWPYLAILTYIYHYLPNITVITLISSYLPLIALVWPCSMCKLLEQSNNYSWRYCISKNWGMQKVLSRMQFWEQSDQYFWMHCIGRYKVLSRTSFRSVTNVWIYLLVLHPF